MADHSFITLYAHIGRRILTVFNHTVRWVRQMLFTLFVVVFCIVYFSGALLPLIDVAHLCAA